jgi:uncharacterized protein (TIGR00297 family)
MVMQLLLGFALSALIGALAYWRRSLTLSGVLGAVLVGTVIFGLGGWIWGLLLITFFVSSSWLSHYRRADKKVIASRSAKGSRRDLGQTLANGGLAAVLAVVYARYSDPVLFAAFLGAMATVNADTWATELGVLSRNSPRLITTGQKVPPGTSGGVSQLGIWASVAGSLLIGTVATALTQISLLVQAGGWSSQAASYSLLAVAGGFVGSLVDSLLGGTVQAIYYCGNCGKQTESAVHHCGQPALPVRGWSWLNNDMVNFASSIVGAMVAALLASLLWR